jgi:DinB superfamily
MATMITPETRSADPVTEVEAYRAQILGWLGDDDPAAVQAATTARMRALIREAGDRLRDRPAPGEWSVIECLGHLLDGEIVVSARVRWIIAEDRPELVGYEQGQWVEALGHRQDDPAALVALFAALRVANLQLWAASPEAIRERVGVHRERGDESYDLLWRMVGGHDRLHLDQAERALAAVRAG